MKMTYEEMNFRLFRDNSNGYRTMFRDHLPVGYGCEISDDLGSIEKERAVNSADDELHDRTTPLYKAADGQLYKVVNHYGVKVWARAELLPDRGERLKEFRSCTLKDLEAKSGILAQNISRLENGARDVARVSGEVLLQLADALGVSIEELVR